jgi:hypothetical protein
LKKWLGYRQADRRDDQTLTHHASCCPLYEDTVANRTVIDGGKGKPLPNPVSDSHLRPPRTSPTWTKARAGLRIRVWEGRFPPHPRRPEDWYIDALYTSRNIVFTITDKQDRVVAAGLFEEWRQNYPPEEAGDVGLICVDQFRVVAENDSRAAAEMSEVVFRMWGGNDTGDENLFNYGNLLSFDRLRIQAATMAESITAWSLIEDLIVRLTKGRERACLMILKAFPLEFESKRPQELNARKEYDRRLQARQEAMCRLYRARLKVEPLPGRFRKWMWRALTDRPPPPKLTRRKDPAECGV